MPEEKMKLTQEGLDLLTKEYRHLIDVERPDVILALQAARAQGDLSENADYDAARDRQAKIESRIQEIEHIFDNYELYDPKDKKAKGIQLTDTVTYKDLSENEEVTVKLVSTIEANPFAEPYPLVSIESALGVALSGKSVGDIVNVNSPDPYDVEIISFSR
ncbi:MAG: transcription elongation factor GreA [Bacillota bacterium]|nr:transcription elongation factor GreA [Bacillota bacterium]